ncbi:MAG TPA: hypothetical protein VL026_11115, partial [Rhizomicrobium sp.]|nr:hypothetical protein [Rhizomicrobium sp.]
MKDLVFLERALDDAHFPALLVSLSHITGNIDQLRDDLKPVYDFFADGRLGGYSEAQQAQVKALAL